MTNHPKPALEEVAEALCLKIDALLKYARHHASCQAVNPMLRGGKCTCGLEEVLK